ncbi:hypothetical protein [Pseudonocardia kunmingensis]|uniref:DUF3558 domain-containing protein n=1 Tax=Pseudonocardia kunmingensis TaxID=630975 RepID=A0A543DJF8_9PSEU|nr:hypothetical protein [Pseudonocardia kunmingensis]TQM09467.1 hypothetical protein FB558_5226 [Pseudonocardia kunmingensis]
MLPRIVVPVVAVLAMGTTAACSVAVPGVPTPTGGGSQPVAPAVELDYDEETAAIAPAYARARTFDICAFHDISAAEEIFGKPVAALLPTSIDIATCDLDLGTFGDAWEIDFAYTEGGARFGEEWATVQVGGRTIKRDPESTRCGTFVPSEDSDVVGLDIEINGPDIVEKESCEPLDRYLTDVVFARMDHPPTLQEGLTGPRSPLLGKDPCSALAAATADVEGDPEYRLPGEGVDRTLAMGAPYRCSGSNGSDIVDYAVNFTVLDEDEIVGEPIEIGGLTAHRADDPPGLSECGFVIPMEPGFEGMKAGESGIKYHTGVEIGLATCDDADMARAEKVVQDLQGQPVAPAPRPDAQRLGRLGG